MLDIMLCLHAEHGGGNNSTFTTRVLSSADTDPYATYSAAIGSLKGRKHGGANHQIRAMHAEAKREIANWEDDEQVVDYLTRVVNREAFDRTGLIYGMGHAVYTKSDPRAVICKEFAGQLARGTEFEAEFRLLESIERLSPEVLTRLFSALDNTANLVVFSALSLISWSSMSRPYSLAVSDEAIAAMLLSPLSLTALAALAVLA